MTGSLLQFYWKHTLLSLTDTFIVLQLSKQEKGDKGQYEKIPSTCEPILYLSRAESYKIVKAMFRRKQKFREQQVVAESQAGDIAYSRSEI